MRKISITLAAVLLVSFSYSQENGYVRKFPNRYKLDLPAEWNKPKLMLAITEILPKTLDELKGKEFCTDCEAGYSIKILINVPYIKSRNNISKGIGNTTFVSSTSASNYAGNYNMYFSMEVVYQFRAALGLFDSTGKNIVDLVLVLPDEEHIKQKDTTMSSGSITTQEVRDITGRIVSRANIPSVNPPPVTNTLSPSLYELLAIAEQRVYSIRDILKDIK